MKLQLAEVALQGGDPAQVAALTQAMAALPPQVSSVPVRKYDDHATELAVCKRILNSPRGRKLANGDDDERAAYQNLELHADEHQAELAKQAANQPPQGLKPPSVSIALKDLPPAPAAAAAARAGLPATPKDFEAQEVAETVARHPKDISIQ
jgi:hypothetical protein